VSTLGQDSLDQTVVAWISEEPDPESKNCLTELLEGHRGGNRDASTTVEELFGARLSFGTAGIRGPIRPGPAGMNQIVVGQTTAGLARFLLESRAPLDKGGFRVVVGCDARTHSDVFAAETAAVLSGAGITAVVLPLALPTPVLAFALRHLNADAGVMITASHNPPADNGYKVFLGGEDAGSQIISPTDSAIETHIASVVSSSTWSAIPRSQDLIVNAPADIVSHYISQTVSAINPSKPVTVAGPVVYTPMHGVGKETFMAAVQAAGFPPPHVVSEQAEPDPLFPTTAFPNPEEAGALDLSFEHGRFLHADLILAHDPDADRLAIAVSDPARPEGYRAFTGNQLGAILGWWAATRAQQAGTSGALANSLVSSPVLGRIAKHFGLSHSETLTGFKYVSRVPDLIFGFEEAIGYLVTPSLVRDKDGISAALAVLDLYYSLAGRGETLEDYLALIEAQVGAFASGQVTIRLDGSAPKTPLTHALRSAVPSMIGSRGVSQCDDFLKGVGSFPKDDILRFFLSDDSRVIVRPSGTEPKIKLYIDTQAATRAEAESRLSEIEADLRELVRALP